MSVLYCDGDGGNRYMDYHQLRFIIAFNNTIYSTYVYRYCLVIFVVYLPEFIHFIHVYGLAGFIPTLMLVLMNIPSIYR